MPLTDYEVNFPIDRMDARGTSQTPTVSLATIFALMMVGVIVRRSSPSFHSRFTPSIRRFAFGVLQPLTVMRSAWLAKIDPLLSTVAVVSCSCHIILSLFWSWMFKHVKREQTKGWLLLSVQGSLVSFLYSTVGGHAKFGERAVSVCLMWDMAGNMWISQGLLYFLAAMHAPKISSKAKQDIDLEDVEGEGQGRRDERAYDPLDARVYGLQRRAVRRT